MSIYKAIAMAIVPAAMCLGLACRDSRSKEPAPFPRQVLRAPRLAAPITIAGDDPATSFKTGDTVEVFLSVNEKPLADRVPRGPGLDTAKPGDYKILITLLRNIKSTVSGSGFVNPACNQNPMLFSSMGPRRSSIMPRRFPGPRWPSAAA